MAYASHSLIPAERTYSITELETLAVVWALTHFVPYPYGHDVTILTDHTAVTAILQTPNPSGKHARWWTKVYGSGVKDVKIQYRPGQRNSSADALSRSPQSPSAAEAVEHNEAHVTTVTSILSESTTDIATLLNADPGTNASKSFADEQRKDPHLLEIFDFIQKEQLPQDEKRARKITLQASLFTIADDMLYYVDPKQEHRKRVAVPGHLQEQILEDSHAGGMAGHFSGMRTYATLVRRWWWDGMHADTL